MDVITMISFKIDFWFGILVVLVSSTLNLQTVDAASSNFKTFQIKLSEPCEGYCTRHAPPMIYKGRIYARGFDNFLYALDQSTGVVIHTYDTERSSSFEPVVNNDTLYVSAWKMYAFDLNNNQLKWKTGWAVSSKPVLDEGVLYWGARGALIAVDSMTSEIKWRFELTGAHFSTPLIHHKHVFVGNYDQMVGQDSGYYSLNKNTGEMEWVIDNSYGYPERLSGFIATPCAIGDRIYMGTTAGVIFTHDSNSGGIGWFYMPKSIFADFSASPFCDSDKIYAVSGHAGYLYSFDGKKNKYLWRFESKKDLRSSPVVHNDIVFFGSDDEYMYAIYKETGELKWKFKADGKIRSRPTIDNGIVYFTTLAGSLYAIDENTGTLDQ
ncbi:PQQ-binding-like beta-propeller repeat protein [Legionella sp. W05-934-2]|uniref:outer membrane protein assembly factor BamB family protein n=1 Tax=Legionella sp. W05-934-2 TaxID=1198649 RepID=UPI003461A232